MRVYLMAFSKNKNTYVVMFTFGEIFAGQYVCIYFNFIIIYLFCNLSHIIIMKHVNKKNIFIIEKSGLWYFLLRNLKFLYI